MSMVMDEAIRGIWYIQLDEKTDFLLNMREEEAEFEIVYRFRYYVDDNAFDSKDKKSWFKVTVDKDKATLEAVLDTIDEMTSGISGMAEIGAVTEILRGDRTLDEFMEEFLAQDFVNTKTESVH